MAALTVGILAAAGGTAAADGLTPRYPRERTARTARPSPAARESMPEALRAGAARTRPGDAGPGRAGPARDASGRALARRAEAAASLTAAELYRRDGRREYYRVGFFRGLSVGIEDRSASRRLFATGERRGRRDPEALAAGADTGWRDATALATARAREQVEEQFLDLSRQPQFLARYGQPIYVAEPPEIPEPLRSAVFAEFPIRGFASLGDRAMRFLEGWDYDAPRLLRCRTYAEFYDDGWTQPASAFELWLSMPRRSSVYRMLPEGDRPLFVELFQAAFVRALARAYFEHGLPAFELGYEDGWAYGGFVRDELDFRRGYAAGFEQAFADGAFTEFHRAYPVEYEHEYRIAFEDWAGNPKPEVAALSLGDADGDGVFQPGETILVDYEIVNYGGCGGDVAATLDGQGLEGPVRTIIALPARASVVSSEPVRIRIDRATPSRTRTEVALRVGRHVGTAGLTVAFPLQLERQGPRIERDDLAGELFVDVRVINVSRRPTAGSVELTVSTWPGRRDVRALGVIEPQGTSVATFTVSGLDPLDLMAGRVSTELRILRDGSLHDEARHLVRDTVRDMRNRDLLRYLVALAADAGSSPEDAVEARRLMLVRLREDWKVAVMADGNPYKRDHKHGGRRTALGDLLQTYLAARPALVRPEVFVGLGAEVARLAPELPGVHPLLRKHYRKLAARLP
jgi:hypothetical protein